MKLVNLILGWGAISTAVLNAAANEELLQLEKDHAQAAFALYQAGNPSQANFVFSPYSISTCLSMVYLGARGETQTQMEKALSLTLDRKTLCRATLALQDSLVPQSSQSPTYKLSSANALWVDQNTFLLTDFRYAVEKQFKAALHKVDFSKTAETLSTINQWVSDQTQHKIPQILSANDIDAKTRLVLVNAVYFQGGWAAPFETAKTQDWPFHPTPDTSVTVPMMQRTGSLPYYENEILQMAALPFSGKSEGGSQLGFLILLPKSSDNFSLVLSELSHNFGQWVSSLSGARIDLKLPKFTQDTRLDLNKTLQEMGMEDAFTSEANFTGIDGMRDLYVNKVVHQAFFSIDEQGVVAAATTAAAMNMTSCGPQKEPPLSLIADHPFLYLLLDLNSQEILFMGTLAKPGSH